MSLRQRLRTVLVCMMLEVGVLMGTPMRTDEIERLMHAMNQPLVTRPEVEESEKGSDP